MSSIAFPPCLRPVPLLVVLCLCLFPEARAADESGTESTDTELPAVIVTARRSAEIARELPFAISVIDGGEIETRRLLKLEDALRSVPGWMSVPGAGSMMPMCAFAGSARCSRSVRRIPRC